LRDQDELALKTMYLKIGESVEASMEEICPQLFIRPKRKRRLGIYSDE